MKTVVITGSARGFGLCQAKKFKESGFNVVISDINENNLQSALEALQAIRPQDTKALSVVCDVTNPRTCRSCGTARRRPLGPWTSGSTTRGSILPISPCAS